MSWLCRFLTSSIGKKVQMAVTGLLLCGFLLAHLGGNLFLYGGADRFNHYAEVLESNPIIPAAELGLLAFLLLHIVSGIWVKLENRKARPVPYADCSRAGGRTWGSASMAASGLLLLAFLIAHVKHFRFDRQPGADLYRLVMASLASRPYALFYTAAMAAVGLHLSHGFQSAFQTLGLNHPKYTPMIRAAGLAFAALVAGGFASIAVWAGFLK